MRRFESAIVVKPCVGESTPTSREGPVFDLLEEHARAVEAHDHGAAIRAATELASIAFHCLREMKRAKSRPLERTVLSVGRDAAWFQWAGGTLVDLRRR